MFGMSELRWDEEFDVVVMGSGAAGLTAALSALAQGATVCVLEKSDKFGGTTAMSGGVAWVPGNPLMAEVGASDTREDALTYLERMSLGRTRRSMLEALVDVGPEAVTFLGEATELELHALKFPDYHPEFPGGTFGRSIMPDIFDGRTLGDLRSKLRTSPHFPVPISLLDMERAGAGGALSDIEQIMPGEALMERMQNDMLAGGTAMVAGMLKAASEKGASLRTDARVTGLVMSGGVAGVEAEIGGAPCTIRARRGVVIASGGFERNAELVQDFIRGPLEASLGCPSCEGDGQILAMEAGAALANMGEAWWQPTAMIDGEEYEGLPFARLMVNERTMPGSIMVNRQGRRFVNEAHNYNDIGRSFHNWDPVQFAFPNTPAYVIMHKPRLDRSAFLTRFPTDPVPRWLISAPTLRELAGKIDVDADGLEATVAQFNEFAAQGLDPEFHRGESRYDSFHGDDNLEGAFATLGPIDTPPFYAMRVLSGTLGTKGGAKTNERAQVLTPRGEPITGLYAAGNAMAGVTGMAYPGAGGTLGPAITFGYIAGRSAAGANK
jgi:succinate dehydrogenase/fumarate reductase flavoprotein subunit